MTTEDNNAPIEEQTVAAENQTAEENNQTEEVNPAAETENKEDVAPKEVELEEKKTPWYQKRIDKLTAEKSEKDRVAQNYKEQADRYLQELADLRSGKVTSEPNTPSPQNTSAAEIDRLAEVKARSMTAADKFNEACNNVYNKGVEAFPDFKEAVSTLNMVGEVTPAFLEIVTELPEAHKVLHHLGNNPEEAERILSLPITKQAIAIAKLESEISKPVSKPVSKVPAPINPIDGKGKVPIALDDPNLETKKWMEAREKELKSKGKRTY